MKILVLGRNGQVARSLAERAASAGGLEIGFVGRPQFDLGDAEKVRRVIGAASPHVVINAAAYTAVDEAESNPEAATRDNAVAPAVIARAAREQGARLIHLSTDYVFDGSSAEPYREDSPVGPINVYGRTKLEGERGIRDQITDHVIIRTSWVYSPFGKNFVKTMLRLAETRQQIKVVGDQIGTPTSALDLADAILSIIDRWKTDAGRGLGHTFHLAGSGSTSWAGLAEHVMMASRKRGGPAATIVPITTAEYETAAARPAFSILASDRFRETFSYTPRAWQSASEEVVERLLREAMRP